MFQRIAKTYRPTAKQHRLYHITWRSIFVREYNRLN